MPKTIFHPRVGHILFTIIWKYFHLIHGPLRKYYWQGMLLFSPSNSCHTITYQVKSCHATPCHVMSHHTKSCHAMPHLVTSHQVMSYHATPCHAMPHHATPWHAMPHMLCHATPCHAMPHHVMLCHITSHHVTYVVVMPFNSLHIGRSSEVEVTLRVYVFVVILTQTKVGHGAYIQYTSKLTPTIINITW